MCTFAVVQNRVRLRRVRCVQVQYNIIIIIIIMMGNTHASAILISHSFRPTWYEMVERPSRAIPIPMHFCRFSVCVSTMGTSASPSSSSYTYTHTHTPHYKRSRFPLLLLVQTVILVLSIYRHGFVPCARVYKTKTLRKKNNIYINVKK
jgi:hypothetical protein